MSGDAAGQIGRAEAMIQLGRCADAIGLLGPVVAAEPDNTRAWGLLAQAQVGTGRPAEALAAAERAIQLDPALAWPHRLRSIAQRQLGRPRDGLSSAAEACRLEPHSWLNHVNLAQAGLDAARQPRAHHPSGSARHLDAARQAIATARELAPSEPSVYYISGLVSRASGDEAGAIEHFRRTLALDPEHSSAVNELGRISLAHGKSGAAAKQFLQAARLAPGQTVYGHNIEVAVARAERSVTRLVNWVIYGSWLLVLFAMYARRELATRLALLAVTVAVAIAVAVFWRIQLHRLPREARPMFRGGSMLLALGVSVGPLAVGVAALEFAPDQIGPYLLVLLLLIVAARFAAFRILRTGARKRHEQLTARSQQLKA